MLFAHEQQAFARFTPASLAAAIAEETGTHPSKPAASESSRSARGRIRTTSARDAKPPTHARLVAR
jgi:hypothetical protein